MSRPRKERFARLSIEDIDRIIEMAWEDRTTRVGRFKSKNQKS